MQKKETTKHPTNKAATKKYTTAPSKSEVLAAQGKPPESAPSVGYTRNKKTKPADELEITIPTPEFGVATFYLKGESPLILNAWSSKALRQILDEQTRGRKLTKKEKELLREAKDPFECFLGAMYVDDEGLMAVRANAIKAAMLGACRHIPNVAMENLKRASFIPKDLVNLYGRPKCRLDHVRVGPHNNRVADIRFRPEYLEWGVEIEIQYLSSILKIENLVNLLMWAGITCGIGEWRNEKGGSFGAFSVMDANSKEAKAHMKKLGRAHIDSFTEDNSGIRAIYTELGALELMKPRSKAVA